MTQQEFDKQMQVFNGLYKGQQDKLLSELKTNKAAHKMLVAALYSQITPDRNHLSWTKKESLNLCRVLKHALLAFQSRELDIPKTADDINVGFDIKDDCVEFHFTINRKV